MKSKSKAVPKVPKKARSVAEGQEVEKNMKKKSESGQSKSEREKLKQELQMENIDNDFFLYEDEYDKVYFMEKLKEHGYNITSQRSSILDVLFSNIKYVMSVEDIAKEVQKLESYANLTTVYRNLEVFENIGIVHRTVFDDNMSYYKICFKSHHHHHFICTNCHRIADMEYCPMGDVEKIAKKNHFDIQYHNFEVFGICERCQQ